MSLRQGIDKRPMVSYVYFLEGLPRDEPTDLSLQLFLTKKAWGLKPTVRFAW